MDNNTIENGGSKLTLPQTDGPLQESFLQIALRQRWIILSTVILFLVVAFFYLLKATPIYTSKSRLYVEQTGPKIIDEYEGVMTRYSNYLYTQGELLKSTPIVADAVDNAEIKRFKTFADVDNLTAYAKRNLDISIGKKDDIITVSFDSPYPAEAAQIVNAVVGSYVSYHSTRKRSTASEVLGILQKEKLKRDEELSSKFAEMLEFTRENGVVSFDNKGGNIVFERLTRLSSALTEAELTILTAKADFEAVKSMANEADKIRQFATASAGTGVRVSVADKETQLRSELRQAEIELKDVRYHCTEDHPSVQATHMKIDRIKQELESQAKEFADAYIEVMQLRWITAEEREDELRASFDDQHLAARDLGVKAAEYSVLQSELNRSERICEILDDRIKEINVTEDVGALNISILEVARPADIPSKPQKARVMAMALALGLMFGGGLALLRDWFDYRLRSSDEVSAVLGIPVLGVVPTMLEGKTIAAHGQKIWFGFRSMPGQVFRTICGTLFSSVSWNKAKAIAPGSPAEGDGKTTPRKQTITARGQNVYLKPKSVTAEAYRTIRTAVFFGAPDGKAKTILITSPAPGDGKSTLVSNLAITMAQAGQRTLILDADFRRPVQHDIFEIEENKGLSSVLAGRGTVEEATQPGPVEGLEIMSCGPEVPNPSELLNSDAFGDTLKNLSERYDRIIIDSPPVGPVADSQILAAVCDVVLLVLRAEKSTRRHSQQTRDSLLSVGAHLLGAVVNDVPQKRGHYGYYSSYGGYGYYGHYGQDGYYGKREKKTG